MRLILSRLGAVALLAACQPKKCLTHAEARKRERRTRQVPAEPLPPEVVVRSKMHARVDAIETAFADALGNASAGPPPSCAHPRWWVPRRRANIAFCSIAEVAHGTVWNH